MKPHGLDALRGDSHSLGSCANRTATKVARGGRIESSFGPHTKGTGDELDRQTQQPIGKRLVTRGLALAAMALAAGQSFAGTPCSPADLNGDGFVDFADYLDFLNLFDAGDLAVDFTGDGLVDFSDYLEFLNLFEEGCPPTCSTTATGAGLHPSLTRYPFAESRQRVPQRHHWSRSPSIRPSCPRSTGKTTRVYITTNQTWADGHAADRRARADSRR